jgi:signal transduction histidine kinase
MFTRPATRAEAVGPEFGDHAAPSPAKRPARWALSNWPVGWKVLAIVLIPLLLATVFAGLRVQNAMSASSDLRLAASRADVIPGITKYMSALDVALLASSSGRDVEGAKKNFEARKYELQSRLAETNVIPDVRSGINNLLNGGQALLDRAAANGVGLRERVTTYAPLLLTAEGVIDASVRVDSGNIRAAAQGLSRAVGARGQMTMQEILVTRGGDLPEPELRTSMITLAGTEPSTLFGMSEVLGAGSPDAKTLQQQMVARMAIMSDPASSLVDNADLLRSIRVTDGIAEQIIKDTTASVTKSVQAQANSRRDAAIRDAVIALVVILVALLVVLLVARALVRPLRRLRDGALKVAHTDLENEIAQVRAGGGEPIPEPLPVQTTEEIGQVAHAVDELHTQALLLAGDEARLRLLVNDMFETMSRRNRSLVDKQLSLIERLERNEENPDRLDSLFRLDHLAARLRRNSANLLVLAGAQLARDPRDPVPLSTVVNAAVSEVEDYRRVETGELPECTVIGTATGSVIHLLAELIDNALRYSPPHAPVWISAMRGADGGVRLSIRDAGLGMNDGDRRIANMRLQSGGDVTPDNARHMGLFVVGRLAFWHGIRVALRGPAADDDAGGSIAEVNLPPTVLVEGGAGGHPQPGRRGRLRTAPPPQEAPPMARPLPVPEPEPVEPVEPLIEASETAGAAEAPPQNGSTPPVTLLPRRNPGSSGIADVPAPETPEQPRQRRELATPWWEAQQNGVQQAPAAAPPPTQPPRPQAVSDTSAFFAARQATRPPVEPIEPPADQPPAEAPSAQAAPADVAPDVAPEPVARSRDPLGGLPIPPPPPEPVDDDVIYQRMLSEMLGDPNELAKHPDLDWKSVWDRGWTLAAAADEKPVESLTDHGLPVRKPGARLVPGAASRHSAPDTAGSTDDQNGVAANGDHPPQHGVRDPEAVRASISSHFGGVHSGRSHARDAGAGNGGGNGEGPESQ